MAESVHDVVLYISEVAGNVAMKKHGEGLKFMLTAAKLPFKAIDVSIDEDAKKYMIGISGKRTLPQVFVDGKFKGGFEECEMANEDGNLKQFLYS